MTTLEDRPFLASQTSSSAIGVDARTGHARPRRSLASTPRKARRDPGRVDKDSEQSIALCRRQAKQVHICVERPVDACSQFEILDTTDLEEQVDQSLTVEVADWDPHQPHRGRLLPRECASNASASHKR